MTTIFSRNIKMKNRPIYLLSNEHISLFYQRDREYRTAK